MQQLAQLLVAVFSSGVVVPLVQGIKERLKLHGTAAAVLTAVVSTLMAFVVNWSQGLLLYTDQPLDFVETLLIIGGSAQVIYAWFKSKELTKPTE